MAPSLFTLLELQALQDLIRRASNMDSGPLVDAANKLEREIRRLELETGVLDNREHMCYPTPEKSPGPYQERDFSSAPLGQKRCHSPSPDGRLVRQRSEPAPPLAADPMEMSTSLYSEPTELPSPMSTEPAPFLGTEANLSALPAKVRIIMGPSESLAGGLTNETMMCRTRPQGVPGANISGGEPLPPARCPRGGIVPVVWQRYAAEQSNENSTGSSGDATVEEMYFSPAVLKGTLPPPVAEVQKLGPIGTHFFSELGVNCQKLLTAVTQGCSHPVLDLFKDLCGSMPKEDIMGVDSLVNLAKRCINCKKASAKSDFLYMINCIQLRCKVISVCQKSGKTKAQVLSTIKLGGGIGPKTLAKYVEDGSKFCLLAGGGSIYLLALLASGEMKTQIRNLTTDIFCRMNMLLRCPSKEQAEGRRVVSTVIPAIDHLRKTFRMTIRSMFDQDLVFSQHILAQYDIGDFRYMDEFFNRITFNCTLRARCWTMWAACDKPISSSLPNTITCYGANADLFQQTRSISQGTTSTHDWASGFDSPSPLTDLDSDMDSDSEVQPTPTFKLNIVNTNFDLTAKENTQVEYRQDNKRDRWYFTQKQRKYAQKAKIATSKSDFANKISAQLKEGHKPDGSYIHVPRHLYEGERLQVNHAGGKMMMIGCYDMPDHLRKHLLDALKMAAPGKMKTVDTDAVGQEYEFEAHHYVWYNRYSTNGKGAPKDIDPAACQKEGNSRQNNTSQNNPRTSSEKQGNLPILVQLKKAFDEVFEWIAKTLKEVLPKDYEIVSQFADVLPAGGISPVYPFSGFVVNFNVTTRIHRDMLDKILCVVLVISDDDCTGGDLCLMEPEIRLEMKSGDLIIFLSTKISHFNMHYKGQCASFVFQTDAQGDSWVVDRGGWKGSKSMNVTDKNM